jgi:hypothetical protein
MVSVDIWMVSILNVKAKYFWIVFCSKMIQVWTISSKIQTLQRIIDDIFFDFMKIKMHYLRLALIG